jgi:hypothetical protein
MYGFQVISLYEAAVGRRKSPTRCATGCEVLHLQNVLVRGRQECPDQPLELMHLGSLAEHAPNTYLPTAALAVWRENRGLSGFGSTVLRW